MAANRPMTRPSNVWRPGIHGQAYVKGSTVYELTPAKMSVGRAQKRQQ